MFYTRSQSMTHFPSLMILGFLRLMPTAISGHLSMNKDSQSICQDKPFRLLGNEVTFCQEEDPAGNTWHLQALPGQAGHLRYGQYYQLPTPTPGPLDLSSCRLYTSTVGSFLLSYRVSDRLWCWSDSSSRDP